MHVAYPRSRSGESGGGGRFLGVAVRSVVLLLLPALLACSTAYLAKRQRMVHADTWFLGFRDSIKLGLVQPPVCLLWDTADKSYNLCVIRWMGTVACVIS